MPNVVLTIGPRACGKSEAIEKEISNFKNKLYIATLWRDPRYIKSIHQHQKRRDLNWNLYEVTGNLRKDYNNINSLLKDMHQPIACMIDGLTTWALNCSLAERSINICAYNIVFFIEKLIATHPNCLWHLVDVSPESFDLIQNKSTFSACQNIHFLLNNNIKFLKTIYW